MLLANHICLLANYKIQINYARTKNTILPCIFLLAEKLSPISLDSIFFFFYKVDFDYYIFELFKHNKIDKKLEENKQGFQLPHAPPKVVILLFNERFSASSIVILNGIEVLKIVYLLFFQKGY